MKYRSANSPSLITCMHTCRWIELQLQCVKDVPLNKGHLTKRDTSIKRTSLLVPMVSVIEGTFHCMNTEISEIQTYAHIR